MREIKFRGKQLKNNQWVTGSLSILPNGSCQISVPDADFGEWWEYVTSESVGQFTGLTDKNGVEIYEGDVGRAEGEDVNATVIYNTTECQFVADYNDGFELQILGEWFIVEGNIHEESQC